MNQTLLLADASATIQRIVELTFAAENIAVVPFSNGEHAIASLDRSVPDIVLADVGMPGRSGYEISRYIKNSPPLAHIPVLLLTGAFEPVDQAKALEAGCDGILIKPFEPKFVIGRDRDRRRTRSSSTSRNWTRHSRTSVHCRHPRQSSRPPRRPLDPLSRRPS